MLLLDEKDLDLDEAIQAARYNWMCIIARIYLVCVCVCVFGLTRGLTRYTWVHPSTLYAHIYFMYVYVSKSIHVYG